MQGAKEFASLFQTGQYGKLYIVSGSHARGSTFRIFILPEGEKAIPNGSNNGPLNKNAIEVFGVTGGQPGWTERYGWLYEGKWKDDFIRLVQEAKGNKNYEEESGQKEMKRKMREERERVQSLLAAY